MANKINTKTAQQIVETVKDVCGHNINFIDQNGTIIASTDKSRIGTFHEIGKQVVLTGDTIDVNEDHSFFGTHAGVNIPILHNGELVAVIGISGDPNEVRKYAYLAQRITLLLLREHELDEKTYYHKDQMNYLVRALIDKESEGSRRLVKYISESEMDPSLQYRVILISLDPRYHPKNLALIESSVFALFQFIGADLFAFQYPSEYVAVISREKFTRQHYAIEQFAKEQQSILRVSTGSAHSIYKQYLSYREAKTAERSPHDTFVSDYASLGLEILCSGVDAETAAFYRTHLLGRLDEKELELLKIYYQNDMSLSETGKKLFLHKNTVQYQLNKIQTKSGFDPRSFRDAAAFYAALLLLEPS